MSQKIEHRYAHEQSVQVMIEPGHSLDGRILALLPHMCSTHNSPMYGCECGGMHVTTCEEIMQPLSAKQKRKMN